MERIYAVPLEDLAPTREFDTFGKLINVIVQNAVVIAGVISFILLVVGGLGVIMGAGSGDTKKMESGKKTVTGAVLGLIIVVGSVWILQLLARITGLSGLSNVVGGQ
ncbi:hypothetical protein A2154_02260 [Candidatus Gottesmanbacteria bacterium RBG_16_43_7]|uniref:Uncharacterized protein n=1 Tax=Candidatus Gottesmanbacteria bacterium RBG_16_43_7 TaxID=1798373 RepID=A0A1F5ZAJ0_9BACT|nr:MAG: hypothetical protein A2154_02260 [Candidatus Gottesmanbacteria bacterium RBG_16_43_7]